MLLSKITTVIWNSRNKKHYVDLGYNFTKMGDKFDVDIKDLTDGSQSEIKIQCDYCGKIFYRKWYVHKKIKEKEIIDKDACCDCCEIKANNSINKKYGNHKELYLATNQKRIKTNLSTYGVKNVFESPEIKLKIVNTNFKKYGVKCCQQNQEIRNKTQETCIKKYGVKNYIEIFKGKYIKENSPCWKGGIQYSRVERATYEYTEWRNSIFKRDLYTCQKCHCKNGKGKYIQLNAHHKYNWNDFPEYRYDINNGITLCSKCHNLFHKIYGKHKNTPLQMDDFLKYDIDKNIC